MEGLRQIQPGKGASPERWIGIAMGATPQHTKGVRVCEGGIELEQAAKGAWGNLVLQTSLKLIQTHSCVPCSR